MNLDQRRALLVAALGFLQLRQPPAEAAPLRQWLDSWRGVGAIVTGMLRQGSDVNLTSYEQGFYTAIMSGQPMKRWVVAPE